VLSYDKYFIILKYFIIKLILSFRKEFVVTNAASWNWRQTCLPPKFLT